LNAEVQIWGIGKTWLDIPLPWLPPSNPKSRCDLASI
jgi:hypothetical protein